MRRRGVIAPRGVRCAAARREDLSQAGAQVAERKVVEHLLAAQIGVKFPPYGEHVLDDARPFRVGLLAVHDDDRRRQAQVVFAVACDYRAGENSSPLAARTSREAVSS